MLKQNDKETVTSGFAVTPYSSLRYVTVFYIMQPEIDPVGYVNLN